jgi:hypothetical protein
MLPSPNLAAPQQIGELIRVASEVGIRPDHPLGLAPEHERRPIGLFDADPPQQLNQRTILRDLTCHASTPRDATRFACSVTGRESAGTYSRLEGCPVSVPKI